MQARKDLITAEELLEMPRSDGRYELVRGKLAFKPFRGGLAGRIASHLLMRVAEASKRGNQGHVLASGTGFLLQRNPDTVLAPAAAWVARGRLPAGLDDGYPPLAPDLIGEVTSIGDGASQLAGKIEAWLQAGSRVVILADADTSTVWEYRPMERPIAHKDGTIDLTDVVVGLELAVPQLFA